MTTPRAGEGTGVERAIGERDFARFQALVHREAGIWLSPAKKALLVGRLARRLRELGLGSYREYYQRAISDGAELVTLLDRVTTNETHFFREPRHFQLLEGELCPRWAAEADQGLRPRRLRVWSAACSTGEEPFSIAMSLSRAFPPGSGWELEILATDLSTRALERARAAVWPIARAREIPPALRRAFMLRGFGGQAGLMKADPHLRAVVRFARLNLSDASWPGLGTFDLILCRNVLIYFSAEVKVRVVGQLLRHLDPRGHLFLGHAESLAGMGHAVRTVVPTVYVHATSDREPRGRREADAPRRAGSIGTPASGTPPLS